MRCFPGEGDPRSLVRRAGRRATRPRKPGFDASERVCGPGPGGHLIAHTAGRLPRRWARDGSRRRCTRLAGSSNGCS